MHGIESGVNGMTKRTVHSRRKFLSIASALLLVFAWRIVSSQALQAQQAVAPHAAAPTTAAFDVADVHASPFEWAPRMDGGNLVGDRYILYDATMTQIIATAYSLDSANVQGGPSWLDWDHFDIIAKAPQSASRETLQLMLQSLLAERFSLVVHKGTAPMPSYVLTAQNGKTRLKESDGKGESGCKWKPQSINSAADALPQNLVTCHNEIMEKFAGDVYAMAGGYLAEPVVDSTGLKGAYDFDLKWTGSESLIRAGAEGISIFDAVDKQLGLKLTLGTAPRPVLTVDSANESPTPNLPDLAKRMPPLPPAQFEVAVIKPSKPDEQGGDRSAGDQVNMQGMTLKDLINFAWDLNSWDPGAMVGAPKWLGEDRFDILAKLASDDAGGAAPKVGQLPEEEMRQMVRALIEDRFQMKDHWEDRPTDAYHLIAVNPKLTPADPKTRTQCYVGPGPDGKDPRLTNPVLNKLVTCQNITMTQFGVQLQAMARGYIHTTVIDDTGLKGSYSFTLSYSGVAQLPGGINADMAGAGPNGAVSLLDAIKNELGLRLEKQKRPVRVLVIDHIEKQPTAN